jgi:hypothetical protein
VGGEKNMKRKSLGALVNPGHGQVQCYRIGGALNSQQKDSGNLLMELKPKALRPGSMRRVAQILTLFVMILLPTGGFGSPLSEELYNQPVPGLYEKISLLTDFYRAFHIYECLVAVRIEEGVTFDIELSDPNDHELKRMQDFLGENFSKLKRHGFSRLSIRIGETRYVWEVK